MDNMRKEFLKIVADVRAHLELQKALGVKSVEVHSLEGVAPQGIAKNTVNPPLSPFSKGGTTVTPTFASSPIEGEDKRGGGIKESPPLTKGGRGGFDPVQSSALASVREELGDCTRCKLHKGRKNIVFGEGNPHAALVFVGEGPGAEEDEQGRPFVGAAGQLLTDIIVKGMKLRREDVYICNIVKCRPPENRNPEPDEIEACEPFLIKQLLAIKPRVIVGLGNVACKTLLKTTERITALRGKWKTYHDILLMPTFHPAYLLRNRSDKALVWKDVQQVMARLQKG